MRLRARHAGGVITLSDVTSEQTIFELKQKIAQVVGLSSANTIQIENTSQEPQVQSLKEGVVQTAHGFLSLRTMEDDNSCLFRSIGYVLCRDTTMSNELRNVIVERIKSDPVSYPDVVLG
ncbi:hypothetical protein G6F56_011888 [Rhizopus delemar]|nr:hypothetical protein G6F56_011888 [Rhizopus delemar]